MRPVLLFVGLITTLPVPASTLFDDDTTLDVRLSGPLSTVISDKREREERSFRISVGGHSFDVAVRVRGNSRVKACPFPPLRLNFRPPDVAGTVFDGETRLKLVTHCRNGSERSQDAVLNEYAAYRAFNLMSPSSYRVRLLKIQYEDSDGKQSRLSESHYGFLIESDESLANRLGGTVAEVDGIRFSDLDMAQAATLSVFQYFIGNNDWSFVTSENDDVCCHNIDLLRVEDRLVPVPYDFDLAAITRANYRMAGRMNVSRERDYSGYCRVPMESLAEAVNRVQEIKDSVMDAMRRVPVLNERTLERRVDFSADYFEEAADSDALLAAFDRTCIGSR